MPQVSQLPTQSPATVEALRNILVLDTLEDRLTAAEQILAASASSIVLPATVVNLSEDTPGSGELFANASTPSGTLRVLEYYVSGVIGVFPVGLATVIPNVGTITIYSDGEWNFQPGANYNGVVPEVTFTATNGSAIRLSRLSITVGAVNDPVIAIPDGAMTAVNEPVTLNIIGNDYDPEGASITLLEVNDTVYTVDTPLAVPNGSVTVHSDRSITYTPTEDYEGTTTFSYRVTDGSQITIGQINIQVGFENFPLFSPALPIFTGSYFDEAHLNFGNTAMRRYGPEFNNGVNVTDSTYTAGQGNFDNTVRESWLYDRATQIYKLYRRTRSPSIRQIALDTAEAYFAGCTPSFNGADFTVGDGEPGDVKYIYPIIAFWYEYETGNPQYRTLAHNLYTQARASFPIAYSTGTAIWTERSMNYAIQACLAEYYTTGDAAALTAAESYFQTLVTMAASSGAPLHPLGQHEGTGGTTPVTSPWMGALLVETLIQLYRINGDEDIVTWIARYADFLMANAFYINNQVTGYLGHYVPAYLVGVGFQQRQDNGPADDGEHNFDVANLLLQGIWAKRELGQSTTAMEARVNDLLIGARFVFDSWTRTTAGLPRYRVYPTRKFGWWFNNAYSRLYFAGLAPLLPINQTLPDIFGDTPVGSTAGLTSGTYLGSPTLTRQWRRFDPDTGTDIAIPGANETSYIFTEDDQSHEVYVVETATNSGGTIQRRSNRISVTAAGSPVITAQPENVLIESGEDAVFTVAVTGNAPIEYEWMVSTDNGNVWTVVAGGDSDTLTLTAVNATFSGRRYRCNITNGQGVVTSNHATLMVMTQLNAVQFNASEGAVLTAAVLPPVASNFTMQALVSFSGARSGSRRVLSNRYIADRVVSFGTNNTFLTYNVALGDSQTGFAGGDLPVDPTDDVWYLVTVSADSVADTGLFRATMQALSGGTQHSITRDKGLDGNLNHVGCEINGGGSANAGLNNMKFQYVRLFNTERTLSQIDDDRTGINVNESVFWWVFEDNGVGGVMVRDASGNNRVPTLVGGTLVAGPLAPVV